jgi:transcriptional regulator with XRE-family HTH domain
VDAERELSLLRAWSEAEVCEYLAAKIRRERRSRKESQEVFAERIGVPLRTYKRFEAHGKGTLETFVRALKGIARTHYMFMLFPQAAPKRGSLGPPPPRTD